MEDGFMKSMDKSFLMMILMQMNRSGWDNMKEWNIG